MSVTLTFDAARRKTYRESGYWGDASLGDYWRQTARAVPDKIAVVDNHGASWTYAALDYAASRLATGYCLRGFNRAIAWPFSFRAGVSLPSFIWPA